MNRRQLSLGLALPVSWAREDFLPGPGNQAALAAIDAQAPGTALLLHGPGGSGKTHLAHVWCAARAARHARGEALATAAVDALARQPLALDDADRVADAAALFHLVNLMRERGHALLLTGQASPAGWPYQLPDLMSRLKAMPVAALAAPGDAELAAVMVKLFADRQLAVGEDVIRYLVPRIERSHAAARGWVAALDAAALAEGRAITVPLARRLIEAEREPEMPGLD